MGKRRGCCNRSVPQRSLPVEGWRRLPEAARVCLGSAGGPPEPERLGHDMQVIVREKDFQRTIFCNGGCFLDLRDTHRESFALGFEELR